MNPEILGKMHRLGTIATPFCTYVYHHGEKMPFYGEERLQWMFAQRSFLDYGVVGTGATDYPPGPFEPLLGIPELRDPHRQPGQYLGSPTRK